jgi:cytidylate kinase
MCQAVSKEAQLREYKDVKEKAMQKEMNDDLEAEMRAWQKSEEERAQKPIQKAN